LAINVVQLGFNNLVHLLGSLEFVLVEVGPKDVKFVKMKPGTELAPAEKEAAEAVAASARAASARLLSCGVQGRILAKFNNLMIAKFSNTRTVLLTSFIRFCLKKFFFRFWRISFFRT
jgi:hypothetical protein